MDLIDYHVSIDPVESDQSKEGSTHKVKSICVKIEETYYCPFCGEELDGFMCDCEDFKNSFRKLQEFLEDPDHKSVLSYANSCESMSFIRPFESLVAGEVTEDQVKVVSKFLDCDEDVVISNCRRVIFEPDYDNALLFLIEKEGKLCLCAIKNVPLKPLSFSLGIRHRKTGHGKTWSHIATFEDWNQFCRFLWAAHPESTLEEMP